MNPPQLRLAKRLVPDGKRLFVGAYGFERRSLGWCYHQKKRKVLNHALIVRYENPKGTNLTDQLQAALNYLGVAEQEEIEYDVRSPHNIEDALGKRFATLLRNFDEVTVDVSAMTKLLALVCLCKLTRFNGTVRIVYSEAEDYAPTQDEYEKPKENMKFMAKLPSQGVESIIRTRCLSSIRMQGQPVTLVAFTSFNEQLVRHMLGTMSPHRLLFINGRPPRRDYAWRERATQEIHEKLIEEYRRDNPPDQKGLLKRVASTLDYRETIKRIEEIHAEFGDYERIICAATGSKMQTIGLFFSKIMFPEIHIEYPTPDSYFVAMTGDEVRHVHEIVLPKFSSFLKKLAKQRTIDSAP